MARIRSVKPEFWVDEKVVELTFPARLLFIGLWNFADDEGRMEYSPKRLKMQIFPADSLDLSELIEELRRNSMVITYTIDGIQYLQVVNFTKHQKIDRRTASKYPAPPSSADFPRVSPSSTDSPRIPANPAESPRVPPTEGKGMEGNGKDQGRGSKTAGAVAPRANPIKDEIWKTALPILQGQGTEEPAARSFLGKLSKDYGEKLLLEAVRDCQRVQPVEAKGWLTARCQERRNGGASLEERNLAATAGWKPPETMQ